MRMLEKETNYMPAGRFAWFAGRDARMKSLVNASRFTDTQHLLAQRVKLGLEMVYSCEEVTIDNCKKWIRVKVHKARVIDPQNLNLLESDWASKGVSKVVTDQGVIYRVV